VPLLFRRERRSTRRREQARAGGVAGEELAGHPQVKDKAAPVVEGGDQVLAAACQAVDGAAGEKAAQGRGRGEEELAPAGGVDLGESAVLQQRRDPAIRRRVTSTSGSSGTSG
jgi:hypothetical protein